MKKIKNALLSVLLFSFAFLVVHDYVMADLGVSSHQEQFLNKVCLSAEVTHSTLDGVSHLHDSVHTMITMDNSDALIPSAFPYIKPSYIEISFATNNNFVLERPPLS